MFSKLLKKLKAPVVIRRVVGHSMLPVLPPGTVVVGTSLLPAPKLGSVVIVRHEGKEKIKRISELRDNEIYLLGDHETASTDSRQFGWLPASDIVATVVWPRHSLKN